MSPKEQLEHMLMNDVLIFSVAQEVGVEKFTQEVLRSLRYFYKLYWLYCSKTVCVIRATEYRIATNSDTCTPDQLDELRQYNAEWLEALRERFDEAVTKVHQFAS